MPRESMPFGPRIPRSKKIHGSRNIMRINYRRILFGVSALVCTLPLSARTQAPLLETAAARMGENASLLKQISVRYQVDVKQLLPPEEIARRMNALNSPSNHASALANRVDCHWAAGFGKEYFETTTRYPDGRTALNKYLVDSEKMVSWSSREDASNADIGVVVIKKERRHVGRFDLRFPEFCIERQSGDSIVKRNESGVMGRRGNA
jgi:hypothetical protein